MKRIIVGCWILCSTLMAHAAAQSPLKLSLHDSIMLALRENPRVQTAQMNITLQKYAVDIAKWQFSPHYEISATRTTSENYSVTNNGYVTSNQTGIDPSVSLLTPIGTKMKLTATNAIGNHYNPGLSLEVIQPLMRGFGRPIVEAALENAIDSEYISHMSADNTLRSTITTVINAYLDVVLAEKTQAIDQDALTRAQRSLAQTKLFIQAGHKAGVELVAVQAEVANTETRLENDKNNVLQARFRLLQAIGIDPNTPVEFTTLDIPGLIHQYKIPTLTTAQELALDHDIQYQTDQILLHGEKQRALKKAEDDARWELNLTGTARAGNSTGGGQNAGLNSLVNGVNQTNALTLNLIIPIDDRQAKYAIASAKIALEEAGRALQQEQWENATNTINNWHTVYSAERSLQLAETAHSLQQKTYDVTNQKYQYGLIDVITLQSAQQQLLTSEETLLAAEINYLRSLAALDQLLGTTLQTWQIKVQSQ